MQNLETIKSKGQQSISNLIDRGKEQPENIQTWGVTALTAVVGGVAVATIAKGVLAIVGTLANPPVALTAGAIGGGVLGWSYMQKRPQAVDGADETAVEAEPSQDETEQVEPVTSASGGVTVEVDKAPEAGGDADIDTDTKADKV